MIPLLLILAPVLHSEAAVKRINLYHGPGDDVVLPCVSESHLDAPSCSNMIWLYNKRTEQTLEEVKNGKVSTESVRAARLDVDTKCSLIIRNITAEDAGFYTCRQGRDLSRDTFVYLSVLTISPAPPDADPKSDGNVTLLCTLFRNSRLDQCKQNSFRWLDETGAELQELRQTNCVSALSVKRQRGPNRRFRCQYVEDQSVRIEVHYPPVSTEPDAEKIYIGSGVGVGLVVLLILTAVLIKRRKKAKVTEDLHQPADALEVQSGVTYCTVSHHKAEVAQRQAKDHDGVTYSEIRAATADTDDDATHLYSCVIKTQ